MNYNEVLDASYAGAKVVNLAGLLDVISISIFKMLLMRYTTTEHSSLLLQETEQLVMVLRTWFILQLLTMCLL